MIAESRQHSFSQRTAVVITACLLVLALAAGTAAWSQTAQGAGQQSDSKQTVQKPESTLFVSGQKVGIDPQTKKLRQLTPEESQALSEDLKNFVAKVPGDLKIYQFQNGMLAVELPEEYMDSIVVTRNPNGTLSTECVKGSKLDLELMQTKNAAKPEQKTGNTSNTSPKPELEEK
jgi:hypothetical protein